MGTIARRHVTGCRAAPACGVAPGQGALDGDAVRRIIGAPANEHPLFIMPVGRA